MTTWRAGEYTDPTVALNSAPSTDPRTIGTAFVNQTPMGTRVVDNFDDRVTYEASIYTDVPQALSRAIPAALESDGVQATQATWLSPAFRYNVNPTRDANEPATPGDVDSVIVNVGNGGSFDETMYRPWAGLPLSGTSDASEAARTMDIIGHDTNVEIDNIVRVGEHYIAEPPLDFPSRFSGHPSTGQVERPWDIEMGSWPWTGDKVAMQRPLTTQPLNFPLPIPNAIPSPTGAGSATYMVNDLDTKPLTFRVAPSPWDTDAGGQYVDSGT